MTVGVTVFLTRQVHERLERFAATHAVSKEAAFAIKIRNGTKLFYGLEMGGKVLLVSPLGDASFLRVHPETTVWQRFLEHLSSKRTRKPDFVEGRDYWKFTADLSDDAYELICELSDIWDYSRSELINRLINLATEVDELLDRGYSAWQRDSDGVAVGKIEFSYE